MKWIAVDQDGQELTHYNTKPQRHYTMNKEGFWYNGDDFDVEEKGTAQKLTGRELTWNDEPVEIQ